jgi:hypothetical protein
MKIKVLLIFLALAIGAALPSPAAEALAPEAQAKVDARIKEIQTWAANAAIVDAVKAQNATPPADHAAMNQDKWKALTILDPAVRSFSKNPAGEFLKSKKDEAVSEAFVSSANGTKVAFLAKTSSWSHLGKPKHDEPMAGKTWQGAVEVDESTGLQQVQIAVPVRDGDKPIGSLVVGLTLAKLKN